MPLRQLYPPPDADNTASSVARVDIIAVHGLNPRSKNDSDHAWDTWRTPSGPKGRLWLRDDLPQFLPESRIFLYVYNSTAVYGKDRDTFLGKASELLEAIRLERDDDDTESRPILFLGHSMGGLLIKQALINAHNNPKYTPIKDATVGLAFFATPHRGGDWMLVSLGGVAAKVATAMGFQKGDDVLETLKKGSIFSEIMQEQWRHQLRKYQIVSFWGALDQIVPAESAQLGMPGDHEHVVKLNADHSGVCKFGQSLEDQDNFKLVRGNIKDLYKIALSIVIEQGKEASQECRTIADWLTPVDYSSQHIDLSKLRQSGTGDWFLELPEFHSWLSGDEQTLFCQGIPGAGKTILTTRVVDFLYSKCRKNSNLGLAYIYCNFRRTAEQMIDDLLASLLKQLFQAQSSVPDAVKSLYSRHQSRGTRPSLQEISKTLHFVIANYSQVYLIVDAVDECQSSNGCQSKLLSNLRSLQAETRAKLFITSRQLPDIEKNFKNCLRLEILARDEDMRKYLDSNVLQLRSFVWENPKLLEEIKTNIIEAAKGMFLFAKLYLDALEDKMTIKAVKRALAQFQAQNIGPGSDDKLELLYDQAMERINGQKDGFRLLANNVLLWIIYVKRPLTTRELQHAIAVETDKRVLDEENFTEIEDMISVCAGLVTVDEEANVIRLAHYSTQQYFVRNRERFFPHAETRIAAICATYLSFYKFKSGPCQNGEDFKKRVQSNRLYDYASKNWGHHARAASEIVPEVMSFLRRTAERQASVQGLHTRTYIGAGMIEGDGQYFQRQMTPLHLATYFGMISTVKLLLDEGANVAAADDNECTPLNWACEYGHFEIIKILLEYGANVNAISNGQEPSLYCAFQSGANPKVIKLLLEKGADVGPAYMGASPPLFWAIESNSVECIKLLLEYGADMEVTDIYDDRALHIACSLGYVKVIKLLLEEGANVAATNSSRMNPLHFASENRDVQVIELLLEYGANIAAIDRYGETPLDKVLAERHVDAVYDAIKLLLTEGLTPESRRLAAIATG